MGIYVFKICWGRSGNTIRFDDKEVGLIEKSFGGKMHNELIKYDSYFEDVGRVVKKIGK